MHPVAGPTAAFIPIVVGIAHEYGPDGLIASTGIAGAMLVVMGATGLGSLVKFVPRPVVTGFTAGEGPLSMEPSWGPWGWEARFSSRVHRGRNASGHGSSSGLCRGQR